MKIDGHMWTGWYERDETNTSKPPTYSSCQVIVHGVVCAQPRAEHQRKAVARPRKEGET